MATLCPTPTLTQMPKNLTLVVATLKRLGALPVVLIVNHLALKELKATNDRQDDGAGLLHQMAQFPIDQVYLYTRHPCLFLPLPAHAVILLFCIEFEFCNNFLKVFCSRLLLEVSLLNCRLGLSCI